MDDAMEATVAVVLATDGSVTMKPPLPIDVVLPRTATLVASPPTQPERRTANDIRGGESSLETKRSAPKAQRAAMKSFLQWRYGDRPAYVVYGDRWIGAKVSPDEIDTLLDRVGDGRFYFHVNELNETWTDPKTHKPGYVTSASHDHAAGSRFIAFDIDAKKYGKRETPYDWLSELHYQKENERLGKMREAAWDRLGVEPDAQWSSGGGVQGLFRLDRIIGNDQASDLTMRLFMVLGGDPNLSKPNQLLRVPGSVNPKTEFGRKPTETHLHFANDTVTTVEELEAALKQAESCGTGPSELGARVGDLDSDPRCVNLSARCKAIIRDGFIQGETPQHQKDPNKRGAWLWDCCWEMADAGMRPPDMLAIVTDQRYGIGAKVKKKHGGAANAVNAAFRIVNERKNARERQSATTDNRAVIRYVDDNLDDLLAQTQDAMLAAGLPIYQRSGKLVYPHRLPVDTVDLYAKRAGGTMTIQRHVDHGLRIEMTKAASFQKFDARSKKWRAGAPPIDFARGLLAWMPGWRFAVLRGISDVPILRVDGTVCTVEGYDQHSMMLIDFGGETYPPVPDRPTRQDALAAIRVLDEVVKGFPFDANRDGLVRCPSRSVALALFLSTLVSQTIDAVPLHLFVAPEARSGKSLLIQCAGIVATGRVPPAMSYTGREEEDEKRLVGAYMAGGPLLFIDNVKKGSKLAGDFLCASITGPTTSCRRLGLTGQTSVPTNSCVAASGNNVGVEGDMSVRSIACTIDAQMERPGERPFKVKLDAYCREHRADLVVACLTIMRAFIVAAERQQTLDGVTPLGGFEQWSELVRAPLIWLGEIDPVMSADALREADPERASLGDLMVAWRDCPALGLRDPKRGDDHGWYTCQQVLFEASTRNGAMLQVALGIIFAPPRTPSVVGLGRYLTGLGRKIVRIGKQVLRVEHRQEPETNRSQYALVVAPDQGDLLHQ